MRTGEMLYGSPGPNWKPNTKYLYSVATINGWTHAGVKELIAFHFKRNSTKELNWDEYNRTMDMIDRLPPNTVTDSYDPNTLDLFE